MRLIDAGALETHEIYEGEFVRVVYADDIDEAPTIDAVPVVRCKYCKHQEKFFYKDRRRKDGGYYIYGCDRAEGYSHVCLDHDFCSKAERRTDETD